MTGALSDCRCQPGKATVSAQAAPAVAALGASAALQADLSAGLREIPGGFFDMGATRSRYAADLDSPRRRVRVSGFALSATTVTNRQFAAFMTESGYRTTAEREGWSFVFAGFLPDPSRHPRHAPGTPWWRQVQGADWAHPEGPGSQVADRPGHPAVHVSWDDAMAFASFTGTRLATEAEWELAARGGLKGARFPWGNALEPGGIPRHNVWQGSFPGEPAARAGQTGTCDALVYPANSYGLHNMTGNVWEWVSDWFGPLPPARMPPVPNPCGAPAGDRKVMRGGSHLCHASYCERYFVHARTSNTPDSSTGHIGFRVASAGLALTASNLPRTADGDAGAAPERR